MEGDRSECAWRFMRGSENVDAREASPRARTNHQAQRCPLPAHPPRPGTAGAVASSVRAAALHTVLCPRTAHVRHPAQALSSSLGDHRIRIVPLFLDGRASSAGDGTPHKFSHSAAPSSSWQVEHCRNRCCFCSGGPSADCARRKIRAGRREKWTCNERFGGAEAEPGRGRDGNRANPWRYWVEELGRRSPMTDMKCEPTRYALTRDCPRWEGEPKPSWSV